MDAKFEAILNSLPSKGPRSRLEPYSELITEMRKRGRTYREIANVLKKACGLKVGTSTVNDFVLARFEVKSGSHKLSASRTRATKRNSKDLQVLIRTQRLTRALEGLRRHWKALQGRLRN